MENMHTDVKVLRVKSIDIPFMIISFLLITFLANNELLLWGEFIH